MLVILRTHTSLTTAQLAEMLETNPRNIREYKKELEEAGYPIRTVRGTNGGYRLDSGSMLPLPALTHAQSEALRQARDYFQADRSFPFSRETVTVLDEILFQSQRIPSSDPIYFVQQNGQIMSEKNRDLLTALRKAIGLKNTVELTYQSKSRPEPVARLVDPYDLICMEGRWYLCGYDHLHHEFRNYRITLQRMHSVRPSFEYFERDPDYRLQDHIGQTSVIKSGREFYKIEVREERARFAQEVAWGEDFHELSQSTPGWCAYAFYSENPNYVMRQLYRFGSDIRLLQPKARADSYVKGLKEILANYQSS